MIIFCILYDFIKIIDIHNKYAVCLNDDHATIISHSMPLTQKYQLMSFRSNSRKKRTSIKIDHYNRHSSQKFRCDICCSSN